MEGITHARAAADGLDEALSEVEEHGWAVLAGSLHSLLAHARPAGWQSVSLRPGDPQVAQLRAVARDAARKNSMSARTGLGAQPLHTDGAHLLEPPDLIALTSSQQHPAATLVWHAARSAVPWDDLRNGVFRVWDGRRHRYLVAFEDGRITFDPCCMEPLDTRSRRVVSFFASALEESERFVWDQDPSTVLLLDNRQSLHAREAVNPRDPPRVLQRLALRRLGAS